MPKCEIQAKANLTTTLKIPLLFHLLINVYDIVTVHPRQ